LDDFYDLAECSRNRTEKAISYIIFKNADLSRPAWPLVWDKDRLMGSTALLAQLRQAVDANFQKQVDFLAEMVRFPSLRGQEAPLQDWLAARLRERGYAVDRYTLEEVPVRHHPNASPVADTDYSRAVQVVAAHRPSQPKGRSLILQGHV